jgi:hypothetical protein
MAAILPTVPIEMPDLAGQAFKLQEYRTTQKKEAADQAQKERSARASQVGVNKLYEQAGEVGQLLNRFKPEVQKAFDTAVKLGEQYTYSGLEEDKRAYLESLGGFNGLLGGAKFQTNKYLEQVNEYRKDPSGFSITGQEFIDFTTGYSNTPAPIEEIMDINSVFTIPKAEEYKYLAPDEMANGAMQLMNTMADTFSPDGVSFNRSGFVDHAINKWLPTMFPANSNAELQAVLYGAQALGDGGLGVFRKPSPQDIQRYAALPQEEKEKFKQVYYKDVEKQLMAMTPTRIGQPKEKEETGGEKTYSNLTPAVIDLDGRAFDIDGETGIMKPKGEARTIAKDVEVYSLPKDSWITSDRYTITAFGRGKDGSIWVRTSTKAVGTGDNYNQQYKKASASDISLMKNTMGVKTYNKYFGVPSQGSSAKPSPQGGISDAELDKYISKAKGTK